MEKEIQKMQEAKTEMPLNEAFLEVIKNLKGQPLLLFILGAGLLFLVAGSRIETFQAVSVPLLAVFILGIVIWGFLETRKFQQGRMRTGNVKIAKGANAEESEAETGGISGVSGKADAKTGDIKIGGKADLKGMKIKTGEIKLNDREKK